MKKYNLMAEYIRKSKKKNKNERIEDNVKPNLLNRNFITDVPNKVWDTDVTYLIFTPLIGMIFSCCAYYTQFLKFVKFF